MAGRKPKYNDPLRTYWIHHYAECGLNSEQIRDVLKITQSNRGFKRWLNRQGIKTEKTKSNVYKDLVLEKGI